MLDGVPQVSILGSLFFLVFINELFDLQSHTKILVDDTSHFNNNIVGI